MHDLPANVAESLYSIVYTQRAVAWLQVDGLGRLAGAGGHLAHHGLDGLRVGEPAGEQVLFLEGFLPLPESPFFVRAMELTDGRAADLQMYADGDQTWILLLDVTAERDATRRVQQKAYEATLLQEKEALLNRRLEAVNSALRAASAEVERSRAALVEAYAQLEVELAEAAAYVRSILPPPMSAPFEADWRFVPSARLGGDCFGYHWVDDGHFAMYLLDVCGHGVGPSLMSVGALNALRSGSLRGADLRDPSQVLAELNEQFQMERHNDLFFSIWYGVYRPADRTLSYAGAGHPPALLLRDAPGGGATVQMLAGAGPPIGVMPGGAWRSSSARVEPGSRVYVLSDGTFEVTRPDAPMLELHDLVAWLEASPRQDAGVLDALLAHLRAAHGSDGLEDDFSIIRFAF
jgi:sigma-B regulation protein RsbU (phosphoserine phosphatase)